MSKARVLAGLLAALGCSLALAGNTYYDAATGNTYSSGTGYSAGATATRTLRTANGTANVAANVRGAAARLNAGISTQPPTVVMALIGPILELSSSTVTFGTIQAGQSSAVSSVTLTNAGDVPLVLAGLSFPVTSPEFSAAHSCPASLNPGATCQVNFQFSPQTAGLRGIVYEIKTTSTRTPLKAISLSGSGLLYSYAWHVSGWTTCSATCGIGTQSRTVWCQRDDGTMSLDTACVGAKPPAAQSCPRFLC